MVLTALLVRQVVRILLVLLEPIPVVQQRVIHVPVVFTVLLVPQVAHFLQLLAQLVHTQVVLRPSVIHVAWVSTTTKQV